MPPPIITLDKLTQRFEDRTIVDALSFSIAEGEVFGFLGHNGAGDPIDLTGAPAAFSITELLVENNVVPGSSAAAPDHLEIAVINSGTTPLTGFSIYYTFTDQDSGKVESVYRALYGFTVPGGGEARINFDDGSVAGNFRANPNSIYITSMAGKAVDVMLKVDGFAPVSAQVMKDKGGAEAAD